VLYGSERDGANVGVTCRDEPPVARNTVAQMLTFPHHLVGVERVAGAVKFARVEPAR
jgi:hypothetical protein